MERKGFTSIAKTGYIVISVMMIICGILFLLRPGISAVIIARISGIILTVFGIFKLIGYFSKDLYRLAFQYDLALGLLLILLGISAITHTTNTLFFISTVIGIFTLVDSLLKIQIAIDSKQFGIGSWWFILSAAIAAAITGFVLILRPVESISIIVMLTGITLFFEGIENIVTAIFAVKISGR